MTAMTPTTEGNSGTKKHKNDERTVICPVEGCEEETLARGLHLHILRSDGNGHGPQNDIPDTINLEDAETVGTREVQMDYPERRNPEEVARLCPYCERPFRGKHGVMIHLGQMQGRKNHPENPKEKHDPDDFAIVEVDDKENVTKIVEEPTTMPSTDRRREAEAQDDYVDQQQVRKHIEDLREQGLDEQADRAEEMLLRD
jgi:hypothetical protein